MANIYKHAIWLYSEIGFVILTSPVYEDEEKATAISIYVRNAAELKTNWQEEYQPFDAIDKKEKDAAAFIFRASATPDIGPDLSQNGKFMLRNVFNQILSTFKFLDVAGGTSN